ncbi:hypothetical protein [Mesorhizobium sp.]|jgi:hypothetical protein|uniref:hypothetical protein n=1 Tax=Mesorhizobium sp. TaxID=1871066 RepID=UPI003563CD44
MFDDHDDLATREAHWLIREFGAEATLHAAMKAQKAIQQKDFARCARWKRILEILAEGRAANSAIAKY